MNAEPVTDEPMNQWKDDYQQYRANADEQERRAYKAEREYRFKDAATYWEAAATSHDFAKQAAREGGDEIAVDDAAILAAAFRRNAARAKERNR